VVVQLESIAVVADDELEEHLAGRRLPRAGVGFSVGE
jgi:hypothetical protein